MFNILVIDDEESIAKLLEMALTRAGYNVQTALDGVEGINMFAEGFFDLVIMDIRMPGMDGNTVARYIRNSISNYTPIIGISGTPWLFEDDSFDALIVKPFSIKDLYNTVNKLIAAPRKLAVIK